MKVREKLMKLIEPVRELLTRLTSAQRISLGVLGVVVALGMTLLVATAPSASGLTLVPVEVTPELLAFLEDSGIEHDNDPTTGKVRVASKSLPRILSRAFETGYDQKDPDFMDWIFKDMDIMETENRMNRKAGVSQRRNIQQTLEGYEGIRKARIQVNLASRRLGVSSSMASTAQVSLTLDPDLQRLKSSVARTVGRVVASAWTIDVKRVHVSDTLGFTYRVDEEDFLNHPDGRQGRERELRREIAAVFFDPTFTPEQFQLELELKVNNTSEAENSTRYDPDGTVSLPKTTRTDESIMIVPVSMSPGTKTNVSGGFQGMGGTGNGQNTRKMAEEVMDTDKVGRIDTKIMRPAGEETSWSIIARVSKPAMIAILREDQRVLGVEDWQPTPDDLTTAIKSELALLKTQIEAYPTTESVVVTVDTFVPPPSVIFEAPGADFTEFLMANGRDIVLVTLAMMACFLLYRVARGGIPELEQLPDPVADLEAFLRDKEEQDREVVEARAAEEDNKETKAWESSEEDSKDLELLSQVSAYATDRPEIAATVIRLWMNDEDDDPKEEPAEPISEEEQS